MRCETLLDLYRSSTSSATEIGKILLKTDLTVMGRFHSPFSALMSLSLLGNTHDW